MTYMLADSGLVLEELADRVRIPTARHETTSMNIQASVSEIRLGGVTVPNTVHNRVQVGAFFGVSERTLTRFADSDWAPTILNEVIRRTPEQVAVYTDDDGVVHDVMKPTKLHFTPHQIVDVALNILPADAKVVDLRHDGKDFSFSARVDQETDDRLWGDAAVGDLTAAGLMFTLPIRERLAPSVATYAYRLVCTNGMTVMDPGFKVDARGQTVDDVLEELERKAQEAFGRVEAQVAAFYDLRNERVENPERTMIRLFEEFDVPTRVRADVLASAAEIGDDPTMFDVVNLITNHANHPDVAFRPTPRLALQGLGGRVISEHAARCNHCRHRLN